MVEEKVEAQFSAVLHVNPVKGDDRATGEPLEPLKTLTAALQQSASGTVIHLSPGVYTIESGEVFPLTIAAGVTVVGQPASRGRGVAIVGSGEFNSPSFALQAVTLLMAGGAQLRGVTLTNPIAKGTGIWIESTEPTIVSCTLRQCGREGIFVTGTAQPAIANCLFQGNTAGLAFVRQAKGEVRRCVVLDNGIGLAASDAAAPLIVESQFAENLSGLRLSGTASPVFRHNTIELNVQEGLAVFGAAQPDLGNPQDAAENCLRNNGGYDLCNHTAIALISVGNLLNPARVTGSVEFPPLQKFAPIGERSPALFAKAQPHWANPFVQALASQNRVADFDNGSFQPAAPLSAADYRRMLGDMLSLQPPAEGLLQSEAPLTRLQAIVTLAQLLDLPSGYPGILSVYRDRAQIPSQTVTAVAAATQNRLVVLFPQRDRLNPLAPITQAEAVAMICQVWVMQGKMQAIASPHIVYPSPHGVAFADIQSHWAKSWIQGAVSQGWLGGDRGGRFNPDVPMPVAEYAEALNPCFGVALPMADRMVSRLQVWQSLLAALPPQVAPLDLLDRYSDAKDLSPSEQETIALATQLRLVINYPQLRQLNPHQAATRAEIAAIGYQALVQLRSCAAIASPYLIDPDQPNQQQPRGSGAPVGIVLQVNVPPANFPNSLLTSQLPTQPSAPLSATEIVLAIAQETLSLLQFQGVEALLRRSTDEPTLPDLTQIWISLQMAVPDRPPEMDSLDDINGIAVSHPADSRESAHLAQLLHKTILRHIDTRSHGVQPDTTWATPIPLTLPMNCITVGFATGREDAINLSDAEYRRCMARAIAEGILRYVQFTAAEGS
jgi:parallel beta-helix repeat protein